MGDGAIVSLPPWGPQIYPIWQGYVSNPTLGVPRWAFAVSGPVILVCFSTLGPSLPGFVDKELMSGGGGRGGGAPAWVGGSKVWDPPSFTITAWVRGPAV